MYVNADVTGPAYDRALTAAAQECTAALAEWHAARAALTDYAMRYAAVMHGRVPGDTDPTVTDPAAFTSRMYQAAFHAVGDTGRTYDDAERRFTALADALTDRARDAVLSAAAELADALSVERGYGAGPDMDTMDAEVTLCDVVSAYRIAAAAAAACGVDYAPDPLTAAAAAAA